MEGYIQEEPNSKKWWKGFFSESVCEDGEGREVIVPDFNKFISSNEVIEANKEDDVRKFLIGKGKVVRFELRSKEREGVKICLCFMYYDEKFSNKRWEDIVKMCPVRCEVGQLLENTVDEPNELIYGQNFQIVLGILTVTRVDSENGESGWNFYHPAFKDGNLFIADSQKNDFPEIQSIHFYC